MGDNSHSFAKQNMLRLAIDFAAAFGVLILVYSALAVNFHQDGGRDWDQFQAEHLLARTSILEHGELPFWMPHRCGGHDSFADPQSTWYSPFGLLVLVFDFPVGARLFVAFCAMFGAFGALQLCWHVRFSRSAGLLVAIIIFLSMPTALYSAGGIPNFCFGLAVLPWLIFFIHSGSNWSAMMAGLLLAFDLYCGDPSHLVWHSLFLLLLGISLASIRRLWRPLKSVLLTGAFAAVFGAPKMIPMLLMMLEHPRPVPVYAWGANSPRITYHAFLHRDIPPFFERPTGNFFALLPSGELASINFLTPETEAELLRDTTVNWVNIGCYIGWIVVALSTLGAFFYLSRWFRRCRTSVSLERESSEALGHRSLSSLLLALIISSLVYYWLSLGENVTPSAWVLLKKLPVFRSLDHPGILLIYSLMPIALLAAVGFDWIASRARQKIKKRSLAVFLGLIHVAVFVDLHLPARDLYPYSFCERKLDFTSNSPKFIQHSFEDPLPYCTYFGPPVTPFVRAGKGNLKGYFAIEIESGVIPIGDAEYRGEVFFLESGSGTIDDEQFTARHIRFSCDHSSDATVIINQNWNAGWQVIRPVKARITRHHDGRIALGMPSGSHAVELCYTPLGLFSGILVFIIGLPALICAIVSVQRRKTREPGITENTSE